MFFTSGIIIAFFCLAFYLIWDQFLKKDSRLSTGLQVLRKKMHKLDTLSIQVNEQVNKQLSALKEQSKQFQELMKEAQALCERLEKTIHIAKNLNSKDHASAKSSESHLTHTLTHPVKEKPVFQFRKSPFVDVDFVASKKDGPDPTI